MNAKPLQFTTFYVGDNLLGLNVKQVQEILHYQPITPVALVPEYVRGLLNLRGQIVTVIDLRTLFGLPPRADDAARMHVIVQAAAEPICLLVDRMHAIVSVPADQLLPPPGTVQGVLARYVREVCQVDDNLVLVLNIENVVQVSERQAETLMKNNN